MNKTDRHITRIYTEIEKKNFINVNSDKKKKKQNMLNHIVGPKSER